MHVMNNQTVLVRYLAGRGSFVPAFDLSAPEWNSKDTDTSHYHQFKSEKTQSRLFYPPEEPSTEASPRAETPPLRDPPSDPTLNEAPVEAPMGE